MEFTAPKQIDIRCGECKQAFMSKRKLVDHSHETGHRTAIHLDHLVDVWHLGKTKHKNEPLHEFLGMSQEQYEKWAAIGA